ncbi:hypothetical protein [Nannocystis sp. SCPEA4]|uniref:hypothetical protein n=1 Tax=Nannocystis sp. SCPEA4 TaxID=2996787 RepID=UPI00227189E0|nr:hypothetical protein [Nannocystis sp. SCPEA4]MCY1061927.1 hypothetical protein [Nannocystis sp. SCPEA4]
MTTSTLPRLARLEWRLASRRAALVVAGLGIVMVALTHVVIPRLPPRAIELMRLGFWLDDLAGVLVLNDLMAVYFPAFFVGLAGSLGVVLLAREEHRLEILLAKPIRAGDFVAARSLPALAATLLVGLVTSLAAAVALVAHGDVGGSVTPAGTFGGGLFLTAVALLLVAALQVVFVRLRDPFVGLLVACLVWLGTCIPSAVLLYRPDVYQANPGLADALTVASLLWHDATAAWLGPLALVLALPLAWLLVRAAGTLLARADAV